MRHLRRSPLWSACALALLLASTRASAQLVDREARARALLVDGRAQALAGRWDAALETYRGLWRLRDSVIFGRALQYTMLGLASAHWALGHPDSATYYWRGGGVTDPRYLRESCGVERQRLLNLAYASHRVLRADPDSVASLYAQAAEVRDVSGAPVDSANELPPLPRLLDPVEAPGERALAILALRTRIGNDASAAQALVAADGPRLRATTDSLRPPSSQRRAGSAEQLGLPVSCVMLSYSPDTLGRLSDTLLARIRAAGVDAVVYRAAHDSLIVFNVLATGDVRVSLVPTGRSALATLAARPNDFADTGFRAVLMPPGARELLNRSGELLVVRDSVLVPVDFARLLARPVRYDVSIYSAALALKPRVVAARAPAAAQTSRPAKAVAQCTLPLPPPRALTALLTAARSARDSAVAFETEAQRLGLAIIALDHSVRNTRRDSATSAKRSALLDSVLANLTAAVDERDRAGDSSAARRLLLAAAGNLASRADGSLRATAWRAARARAAAAYLRLAERARSEGDSGIVATSLEELASLTNDDESAVAALRELTILRARLGDREGEARALLALAEKLPETSGDRLAAYRRAARLAYEEDDVARALETLSDSRASRAAALIPWDDELAWTSTSRFGLPSELPELRRMANMLADSGDATNAARLLHVVGTVYEKRIEKFQIDTIIADTARRVFEAALALRRSAKDAAGESRTLLHLASVGLAIARDSAALRGAIQLITRAKDVAVRGRAPWDAARAADLDAVVGLVSSKDTVAHTAALARVAHTLLSAGDSVRAAQMMTRVAALLYQGDKIDSALAVDRSASAIARQSGDALGAELADEDLATLFRMSGHSDSAAVVLTRALATARRLNLGDAERVLLRRLGELSTDVGQNAVAARYFHELIDVGRQSMTNVAAAARESGVAYALLRRPDSAAVLLSQALPLADDAFARRTLGMLLLEAGCPDSAAASFEAAAQVQQSIGLYSVTDWLEWAPYFESAARALMATSSRPDSAIAYLGFARGIWHRARMDSADVRTLGAIAQLYEEMGRDSAAAFYRGEAGRITAGHATSTVGGAKTIRSNREARATLARTLSIEALQDSLRVAKQQGRRFDEAQLLQTIAEKYRIAPQRDLVRATVMFDSAAAIYAELMSHAGEEANRVFLAERAGRVYESWSLTWLALAAEVGPRASSLAALAVADRGRSRVLRDVRHSQASPNDTLFDKLRLPGTAPLTGIRFTDVIRAGADVVKEAEEILPAGGVEAAVVSYLVTDDTVVVWLKRLRRAGDEITVARQPIPRDSLVALVAGLRTALGVDSARTRLSRSGEIAAAGDVPADSVAARALRSVAAVLFPEEIRELLPAQGELVIAAHGPLGEVPFAALPLAGSDSAIGARYALRYAPSLRLLSEMEFQNVGLFEGRRWKRNPATSITFGLNGVFDDMTPYRDSVDWRKQALIIGDPVMPRIPSGATLPNLPGASTEAQQIAKLFHVRALTDAAASETALRARLADATVVHLATHGVAYSGEEDTRASFIALAPSRTATADAQSKDGMLTEADLIDDFSLHTNADLVVLSACQTALGNLKNAEGVLGLQRAFLAKGALSVLASLWSVSDAATAKLMLRFYEHWLNDRSRPSKAEALRLAQIDVMTDPAHPEWKHPRFWAAFQLVGSN